MNTRHDPTAYDRYFCLKVPFHLIVVMAFAARHLLIVFLAYNPSPKMATSFSFLQAYQNPLFIAADLPALLLLIAWAKRLPASGKAWRTIWKHGRLLLTLTFLAQAALLVTLNGHDIWHTYGLSTSQRFVIFNLGMTALAIYYLWRVTLVREVFADFPESGANDKLMP